MTVCPAEKEICNIHGLTLQFHLLNDDCMIQRKHRAVRIDVKIDHSIIFCVTKYGMQRGMRKLIITTACELSFVYSFSRV